MIQMKFIHTIRWKFVFNFFFSALLSLAIALLLYVVVHSLLYGYPRTSPIIPDLLYRLPNLSIPFDFRSSSWATPVRWVINNYGSTPVMVIAGVISFVLFFFLFSRRMIRYLEEITSGIQEIAKGNLSHQIKKKTSDELGIMAETINHMAQQLKKSIEEERHAEKTKNDLITGVSHDLRTPLTSIIGFLEYIDNDRYKDEAELRYYVRIAHEKSQSLKKLIDDLFEYTRINSSDLPLNFIELNISNFLKQLAEEFVPMLSDKKMDYLITHDEGPLIVSADGNELVRAYENVLSNAIRFGNSGTTVRIDIQRIHEEAVISITNSGDSIPEQDLPYIFERFYRVDPSRSRQAGGTGLGLAITKSIIELHGGSITASSTAKQTVFETRLPLVNT